MAYSVSPIIGTDFNGIVPVNPNSAGDGVPSMGPLGTQAFGSSGRLFVLAQADGNISSGDSATTINVTTFQAVGDDGGDYLAPSVDVANGEFAWFSKASV